MSLSSRDLEALLQDIEPVARRAGEVLLRHRQQLAGVRTEFKGRRELVTVADRDAERVVVEHLLQRHPEHAVLAEEGVLTPAGQPHRASDRVWIVDPLDGTTNFVHDLPHFAVAIALVERGVPVLGLVYAPVLGHLYAAARGVGAFRDGKRLAVTKTGDLADALVATGFAYNRNDPAHDDNSGRLARILPRCRDLRRHGSAELDLCMVGDGRFDGYWELYLAPYDVAAGAVVVVEAGGTVTDLSGGDQWLYGGQILASNGRIHAEMLAVVGNTRAGEGP
ncbi:MAG: inositol monophosphatase family protein [Planctomycetota bacterium]